MKPDLIESASARMIADSIATEIGPQLRPYGISLLVAIVRPDGTGNAQVALATTLKPEGLRLTVRYIDDLARKHAPGEG